jgi:hypothetical protein
MLLVACQREADNAGGGGETLAASPVVRGDTAAAAAIPLCPATGLWAECAIVYRLDRAGLVPRVDSSAPVTEEPLTVRGRKILVGRSELELYLYPDAASRERELAAIDRTKYVEYPAPVPINPMPTLIHSANAIVILHSRNDHQRERISDLITAGPPQPSSKRP